MAQMARELLECMWRTVNRCLVLEKLNKTLKQCRRVQDYNLPAKTFWSILIFNFEYKTVMSFYDYEIAVKKWSFKFLQGALQNEKKKQTKWNLEV